MSEPDRVSFSLGRKISDNEFGSFDVHISYSTDVQPGESPHRACARAERFVEKEVGRRIKMIEEEINR